MTLTAAIIITVIAIFFSGLFSGSEIAFVQSSRVRLEIDATKGGVINRIIKRFSDHEDRFISTLLVGNNVVLVVYGITFSFIVNPILERTGLGEVFVLVSNTVLSTGIILLLGEYMPKTTFRINPNFMMRVLAIPLWIIYLILYPVSLFVSWLSSLGMKLFGVAEDKKESSSLTMDQLDDYIEESIHQTADKDAVNNEVKIFRNAIDFKDTVISECMRPRNEIVAVPLETTTREQLLRKFIATGLSKIIVFRGDIDDVAGYIHISELFDPEKDWRKGVRPVIFTPETMLANKMMRRMLAEKRSMAIVIDEFGGTAGLCTLEDLVEEIFGEIEDEHDRQRAMARKIGENIYEFSGRAEIEYLNEEYGMDLKESDEYHTLAGYLLAYTEKLPNQGDVIEIEGIRYTIVKMSATRIEWVRATPV